MTVIERAHALRRRYPRLSASTRLAIARNLAGPTLEFHHRGSDEVATFERDGFCIEARITTDDEVDTTWLGEFTDRWEPDAVKNPNHQYDPSRTYKWFVPELATMESLYPHYRRMGASKSVAREWVRQDAERDARIAAEANAYGVIVSVMKAGVKLGESSLWDVYFDEDDLDGHHYATDIVNDVLPEALAEAREALPALVEGLLA